MTNAYSAANILKRFIPALTIAFAIQATPISADIYRWVDEDGSVHYSDIKPNNKKSESIKAKTGKVNEDFVDNPEAQAKELDEQSKKNSVIAERQAEIDKEKAETDEKCAQIRKNVRTIEENSRIRVEEEGQIRFLSAEEIIEKKNTYQKMLEEHCN